MPIWNSIICNGLWIILNFVCLEAVTDGEGPFPCVRASAGNSVEAVGSNARGALFTLRLRAVRSPKESLPISRGSSRDENEDRDQLTHHRH